MLRSPVCFFCSGTNKQTKSDIKRQPKRNRKRKQLFGDIFGDNSGFGEISPLKLTKSTNISGNDPCVAPAVTVQSKLASIELSNPDSEEDGCTIEPAPSSVIKTILSKPAAVYTDRKIASMRKGDSTAVKQATKCFFCNQLKFKNRNTKLTTIKQPSSSDKVVWCHSLCKKVFETRLSRASREDAEGNLENSQQEPSIPNLSEILLNEGMLGLHKYHGPFVYTHIPLASLTHGTESQQSTQRILAQKALFEIVSSLNGESAQKSGTDTSELAIKNVCSTKGNTFVRAVRAVKNVGNLKTRKAAKNRVSVLKHITNNFIVNKNDLGNQKQVFSMAPKHIAKNLQEVTAAASGICIRPFDASVLAALEEKLGLSYRESVMLRYFLKAQGAGKLFGPACSEKKVREAKHMAGSSIEFKVGTVNVYTKTEDSNVMSEVCYMTVKSFDEALAWIAADMDRRKSYRFFKFHKIGEFLILMGGDTGGRHFKFVFICTHQENANSGDNCNIWVMCEKFKETYRNLAQVLVPLTGKALGEIVRQEKQLVRVKEFLKDYNKPFKTASFVTNCAALKPLFCSKILHCGPAIASNAIEIPSQKGIVLQFFCGVQNAEDGSYELTNLITIQILNFQLDNFVKPEHLEEYFLVPYLCAVDGDPLVLSNYKRKGVHIFDLSASNLAYKVLENVPYQGDRITVCKQLHLPQEHNNLNKFPSVMLLVCFQLVTYKYMGDYQFIYRSLGHAAHFMHDKYRCIFCTYNFQSTEVGRLRTIEEFYTLSALHKQKPTLRGECTYGIINSPLFPIPLHNVVLPLLHSFLGLFQKSAEAFKRDLRKIDQKKITDPKERNPSLFAQLEQKLKQLTLQTVVAREMVQNCEAEENLTKTRISEIHDLLEPIHANWKRGDAGRFVTKRDDLTEQEIHDFLMLRDTGLGLKSELENQQKLTQQKKKQLTELEGCMKKLRTEIKNVQGPLEARAAFVMEFRLGLKGNVWWGDFIGPDMSAFLKKPTNGELPKFMMLLASIMDEIAPHHDLLCSGDIEEGSTWNEIEDLLARYRGMWDAFADLYAAVKTSGYIDDMRLALIEKLHPRFCTIFESVVCIKEPPPKFHCINAHLLDLIRRHRCSWALSEEGLESSHHILRILHEQNARRCGFEAKLLGTAASYSQRKNAGFAAAAQAAVQDGKRCRKV